MKKSIPVFCGTLLFFSIAMAVTSYNVTMEKKVNYNSWGTAWDTVVVVTNNIITIAAVPKLGGRVMQYDLGTHPSIYVNPNMINKTITTGDSMVGGFRQLPSPQSDFGWPAPPTLDYGQYKCIIRSNTADSCVVYLESPIENSSDSKYSTHKGLQYKRTLTMYKASSRVKVEMVMINAGTASSTLTHGIWDITQTDCKNNNTYDKQNIWVYFPLNPNSAMGANKFVQYMDQGTDATQWHKDIAPGIMGVQYGQVVAKIGADCSGGWICFMDRLDGYAYVKTFTYQAGKTYPDSGASVQVYTYKNYPNTEVEVLGPVTALAKGDSVTMVENWFAARTKGPVYSVNSAGLVAKPIAITQSGSSVKVQGSYGVFYPGMVKAIFKNASGADVAAADSYAVSPKDSFVLNDTLKAVSGATKLALALYSSGNLMGILDTAAITPVGISGPSAAPCLSLDKPLSVSWKGNALLIGAPYEGSYRIDLTSLDGRQIMSLSGNKPTVHSVPLSNFSAGVLCVRSHFAGKVETKRVIGGITVN
jgi:hypothetical protein